MTPDPQRASGAAAVQLLLLLSLATLSLCPDAGEAAPAASRLLASLFPSSSSQIEVAAPIRGPDIKLGDGDVVGGTNYIYKCKICDMPRIFVMDYGSFIVR